MNALHRAVDGTIIQLELLWSNNNYTSPPAYE